MYAKNELNELEMWIMEIQKGKENCCVYILFIFAGQIKSKGKLKRHISQDN